MYTINCRGKLISLETPIVMGVLNITPDSFYKGYIDASADKILTMAGKILEDGAAIIDIGGQSSRPGSTRISAEEELLRIMPAVTGIRNRFPNAIISIDTYSAFVAKNAINAGADIINDISFGIMDPGMLPLAGELKVPFIGMHMKGRPETMQIDPSYEDITTEVLEYFRLQVIKARSYGIKDIILDPGFGFGKNSGHNMELLHRLDAFKIFGLPLLAGLSRKSTICRILDLKPDEALNGTTIMNTIALLNGASILRVHDVKEAMEAVKLVQAYKKMAPVSGSH